LTSLLDEISHLEMLRTLVLGKNLFSDEEKNKIKKLLPT